VASGCAKALDRLFRALASAPRREILRLAARQKCAVTQFATQLNMSQPVESKHVRVLVDAALITKTRDGRYRSCRLRRSAFEPARESIEELCEAVPLISRRRDAGPQVMRNRFRSLKTLSAVVALNCLEDRRKPN
jgi:DNA-binding transcriptional ArsR family regulator